MQQSIAINNNQQIESQEIVALCRDIGLQGLRLQASSGAMPSGHNGPHNHHMTPVRNTGHWSILFAYLYHNTGEIMWRNASKNALNYIISSEGRPLGGAFHHRTHHFKSSYNGLIGQAWSLEALSYGSHALGNSLYCRVAHDVSEMHQFDPDMGLWHELDIDGSLRAMGGTLNQQIWFTAMSLYSRNGQDMALYASRFLDRLSHNARLRKSGLFYTAVHRKPNSLIRKLIPMRYVRHMMSRDERLVIDAGYHVFTLLGLANIKNFLPEHPFFRTNVINRALSFAFTHEYTELLRDNPYGLQYNVQGFELPVVWEAFKGQLPSESKHFAIDLYRRQLELYSSSKREKQDNSDFDLETFMARFYEITRINNGFWQRDRESR